MGSRGMSLAMLDDVMAVIETGSRPPGGAGYDTIGVPSIGGENLRLDGSLDLHAVRRVPGEFVAVLRTGHLEPGDVLINKDGAQAGKVARYRGEFTEAVINEHVFLLRGTDSIRQDYLFHVLRSDGTQHTIRGLITGSAQPGLNRGFSKATWLPLPPLEEQRRIAEILDAIDDTIRATERVIAKCKQVRSGLAADLLTGRTSTLRESQESSGVTESSVPRWEKRQLGDIGTVVGGGTPPRETPHCSGAAEWIAASLGQLIELVYGAALADGDRSGSGYPVFGSNGIVGYHDQPLVAGPGVVVGRKGSVGALAWSDRDFWPIDTTYWVKIGPLRTLDLRWVYETLKLCGLQHLNSSTGVPGLNREDAYERLVHVPPLEEQRRIAEILDSVDESIRSNEAQRDKLRRVRTGLADDLLSGRVRTVAV